MMIMFTTEEIRPADIRPAYALMRSAVPSLTLAAWTRFARRAAAPRKAGSSGILVVRGARAYPVGLVCWQVADGLDGSATLRADEFVALELLEARPITAALVRGLETLAGRLGCNEVESVLHGADATVPAWFEREGYRHAGTVYRKPAGEAVGDVSHGSSFGPARPAPP